MEQHGDLCECGQCIYGGPTRSENHFTQKMKIIIVPLAPLMWHAEDSRLKPGGHYIQHEDVIGYWYGPFQTRIEAEEFKKNAEYVHPNYW